MAENNIIYVGNKPVMNYILAVVESFNSGAKEVIIKARGNAIPRAVDTVEIMKNRFMTGIKVDNINIGTERIKSENRESNVSFIEIVVSK